MTRGPHWRAVAARACSLLLRYPDAEILATLPTLASALDELPRRLARPLREVTNRRAAASPYELAGEYVDLFDLRKRCCLYLTYYTDGDTRKRGAALARFAAAYRSAGVTVAGGELPDYLPAVLDLAAADDAGWLLLTESRVALNLLLAALGREKSVYRQVVKAVLALLPPTTARELAVVARLASGGPPQEAVGVDPVLPVELSRPMRAAP